MNKFFPFLLITFLIYCILMMAYPAPIHAKQHDSFTTARNLGTEQTVSVLIPAYASEYLCFNPPHDRTSKLHLLLSNTSNIHISLYDSSGELLKTDTSPSGAIDCSDALSQEERHFIAIYNNSQYDKELKISLKTSQTTKAADKSKGFPKRKQTSKKKQKVSVIHSSKKKQNVNIKRTPKEEQNITIKQAPKEEQNVSVKRTPKEKQNVSVKRTPKEEQNVSVKQAPKKKQSAKTKAVPSFGPATAKPDSKSNPEPSTHFLRMKAGTSLAIPEALHLSDDYHKLSYQLVFSDIISIQNGILYAHSPGISVISIKEGNFKTTCTIRIQ